jgi:hypothetical protein
MESQLFEKQMRLNEIMVDMDELWMSEWTTSFINNEFNTAFNAVKIDTNGIIVFGYHGPWS